LTCGFVRSNFCFPISSSGGVSYVPCAAETISPATDCGASS
jgi:hypothetical protein